MRAGRGEMGDGRFPFVFVGSFSAVILFFFTRPHYDLSSERLSLELLGGKEGGRAGERSENDAASRSRRVAQL